MNNYAPTSNGSIPEDALPNGPMISYMETLFSFTAIEELWRFHLADMSGYGFDRLLYGLTRFRTKHGLGSTEDFLVLSNHDPAYLKQFLQGGLYINAPMLNWTTSNVGAMSWSWITENYESFTEAQKEVVRFNKSMGVDVGYSVSFHDGLARLKGGIGLVANPGTKQEEVDAIWRCYGREIAVKNELVHLKIASLPHIASTRSLTSRQREALEWVGQGKTMQDIATIMNLTPATVEKHLRLAREVLNVETTAQAVMKASIQNQIYTFDQ